jgi:hypothetical protein
MSRKKGKLMLNYNSISANNSNEYNQLNYLRNHFTRSEQRCVSRASTSSTWWFQYVIALLNYYNNTYYTHQLSQIRRSSNYVYDTQYYRGTSETLAPNYDDDLTHYNSVLHLRVVEVTGHITDTFEQALPNEYNQRNGWVEHNAISLALKMTMRHRIRVFINDTTINDIPRRRVHIYTAGSVLDTENDMLLYRKIISVLPLLVPVENFVEEHPVFTELLRSITTIDDASVWLQHVTSYLNSIESFRNLATAETREALNQLNALQRKIIVNRINEQRVTVDTIKEQFALALRQLRVAQNEYANLSDTELSENEVNMLISKDIVSKLKVSGQTLYFMCEAPVLSYNKAEAEAYYRQLCRRENPDSRYARIFKACFVDERFVMFFRDALTINLNEISFTARGTSYQRWHDTNGFPNPHHYYYNCWGSYEDIIHELISKYDYMQLFLQIKTAVGSLNMVDYTVLSRFREFLNDCSPSKKCIDWKDGTGKHSIEETIEKLTEEETSNETN